MDIRIPKYPVSVWVAFAFLMVWFWQIDPFWALFGPFFFVGYEWGIIFNKKVNQDE